MSEFTITVPITFGEEQIERFLNYYNSMWIHEDDGETPITFEEFKSNPKLQEHFISELATGDVADEIVESSSDAMANDWLMDWKEYR